MQPYPKLTRQRLAELPPGTPIRIGVLLVTFSGYAIRPNYKGEDEAFVDYTLPDGSSGSHMEYTLLESGTEHLDSVKCAYCGRFRHPEDTHKRPITYWNRTEHDDFCTDRGCAALCQQTVRRPSSNRQKLRRRIYP